jgi:hypothetical protein
MILVGCQGTALVLLPVQTWTRLKRGSQLCGRKQENVPPNKNARMVHFRLRARLPRFTPIQHSLSFVPGFWERSSSIGKLRVSHMLSFITGIAASSLLGQSQVLKQ